MPKQPVSVGFLGAGNVLWAYLRTLDPLVASGEAMLGGIFARSAARQRELARARPGVPLATTAKELLARGINVAVVITPPDSHVPLSREALEAGCHVLVEKPLAGDARHARELVKFAARCGRHIVAAPFTHLSPTFALLGHLTRSGAIGHVHSARALYGNAGASWAKWYHESRVGPLGEIGIYNLKSLVALLGPVRQIDHWERRSGVARRIQGKKIRRPDPDVAQTLLEHASGAISALTSSHAIIRYERPAIELYGTAGTANLLGDDWDPRGVDLWRAERGYWERYPAIEPTWHWTDGLNDLVRAVRAGRAPQANLDLDVHLLDVIDAAAKAARSRRVVNIARTAQWKRAWDLPTPAVRIETQTLHDHTRPSHQQ